MTTTQYPFSVHCHFCEATIFSWSPAILTDEFPVCVDCELTSLLKDDDFAWTFFDRDVNPNDEV